MVNSEYGNFWNRVLAFIIDGIVMGIISFGLSILLTFTISGLDENLWYLGFIIAGLYFSILNSKIGNGQTLGKKILKIRVVDKYGKLISLFDSAKRYLILSIFIFGSGVTAMFNTMLYPNLTVTFIIYSIITILSTAVFLGIAGFLIYNKERRGIHDYLINTVVVKSKSPSDVKVSKLRPFGQFIKEQKVGFIVILVLFVITSSLLIIVPKAISDKVSDMEQINEILPIKEELERNIPISNVGVQYQTSSFYDYTTKEKSTTKNFVVTGFADYKLLKDETKREELLLSIKETVEDSYPQIVEYDNILIVLRTGYNLKIGNFHMTFKEVYPVE